jgi:hypothetical protein
MRAERVPPSKLTAQPFEFLPVVIDRLLPAGRCEFAKIAHPPNGGLIKTFGFMKLM